MTRRIPAEKPSPALKNRAVAACCAALDRTVQEKMAEGNSENEAVWDAKQAYCKAMPPLSSARNIRDFIACVAHGILIDAIYCDDSSKLLYAAQVALSSLRSLPKKEQKRA
jgi:hypothetical protein